MLRIPELNLFILGAIEDCSIIPESDLHFLEAYRSPIYILPESDLHFLEAYRSPIYILPESDVFFPRKSLICKGSGADKLLTLLFLKLKNNNTDDVDPFWILKGEKANG